MGACVRILGVEMKRVSRDSFFFFSFRGYFLNAYTGLKKVRLFFDVVSGLFQVEIIAIHIILTEISLENTFPYLIL